MIVGKYTTGPCRLFILTMLILQGAAIKSFGQSAPKATGTLVDAGGHLLHIHKMGKGKPVVIMESGSGDFSFIWDLVQPEIAKATTAVSYDRAGFAWSEQGPLPRSARQIAYELHTALHNGGIKWPLYFSGTILRRLFGAIICKVL